MLHTSPSTPNLLKTHIICTQTGNAKVKKMGQRADWQEKNSISTLVLTCKLDSFLSEIKSITFCTCTKNING
jgi:hypothetical protein